MMCLGHECYHCCFLVNLGGVESPKTQSVRVVIGFWWMVCIIITATYSANLFAFFTVFKPSFPFNNLEELLGQDDYMFGTLGGTGFETTMKVSPAIYHG